jgi:hypothetical protein
MIDWGSFEVNASAAGGGGGVGLAGLASKGYGQGQVFTMARTLSEHPDQVTGGGHKSILGWIGGQTPAMQSLPRTLTLAEDGSGLLQDFASELLALRKPGGPAVVAGQAGMRAGVRSQQVEISATFTVAEGAQGVAPFGVRMLVSDNGAFSADAGINYTQKHVFLLGSAGPLYPMPSTAGAHTAGGGNVTISMHAIVDHSILTVIFNNKTAFTLFYSPRGESYELFGVGQGTQVQGALAVWDLFSANNSGQSTVP